METKIEGLILSKIPYRERDLVCKLLLRSGKKISVVFFGGRGGGAKKKSSIMEIGHMLKVELRRTKPHSDLYSAKEWSLLWHHQKIREDHIAFYLMCFILEVASKVTVDGNLHDQHGEYDKSLEGLFRVVSNAVFHLDSSVKNKEFQKYSHLIIFIVKLLHEQGVYPEMKICTSCGDTLLNGEFVHLAPNHGGFICGKCIAIDSSLGVLADIGATGRYIYDLLRTISALKYSDYSQIDIQDPFVAQLIFNFFCYQFNFNKGDFKSLPMVL